MKKLISLFPFAIAVALTGCTTSSSDVTAESTNAQPAWQANPNSTEFQSNPMPAYTPPAVQPTYVPATANTTDYNANMDVNVSETKGNCQVVRDGAGTPIYSQMTKGCYTGETYTVGAQDTLYFISFLVGKTANELAALNNISPTAKLSLGQVLRVQ